MILLIKIYTHMEDNHCMFFLYVDGSGQPMIKEKNSHNGWYILSGIVVHERNWRIIEERVSALKRELFPQLIPQSWELHAVEIWNNRGFFSNPELKINFDKKKEIFSKVLELICTSELRIINVIVLKDKLNKKYVEPKVMEYSWTSLVERFEHLLQTESEGTNNGLLFIDSDQKNFEKEIKDLIWGLVRNGSAAKRIDHVIEDPIFKKSHLRHLIQLADMVAYVIHKHYRGDTQFDNWFEGLKPKMYQPNGDLNSFGLKEFPDYR